MSAATHVGFNRMRNFASRGGATLDVRRLYASPARLKLDEWALIGDWTVGRESAVLNTAPGRMAITCLARDLHLVMGRSRATRSIRFRVTNGRNAPGTVAGHDVDESGFGVVDGLRVHQLICQRDSTVERLIEIEFFDAGVEA